MIYLDYAADTPACDSVLEAFVKASQTYFANPNANHQLGQEAKARIEEATGCMADLLGIQKQELIYT